MARTDRIVNGVVLGILGLNALWMLVIPSFPTLDGWAHLHTARMLMDGSTGDLYCTNTGAVPNRTGHVLLGLLQVMLPALTAERVLLALIVWLTGWGTWSLARAMGGSGLLALLALPFTWNFLLVLGFHNFLLGSGLALLGAAWWIRVDQVTPWRLLLLSVLGLLLYHTHSTALLFFLAVAGAHELGVLLRLRDRTSFDLRGRPVPGIVAFAAAVMPALVMLIGFQSGQGIDWSQADPRGAAQGFKDLRVLLLYHGWDEGKFIYAMKLVLVASAVSLALARAGRARRPLLAHRDMLLLLALGLFAAQLVLPDSTGLAGYITVRLQLMTWLLLVAWAAAQPVQPTLVLGPVLIVLMVHQARARYIRNFMAPLAEPRDRVMEAAAHLPEGSVVLPLASDTHWELGHISSLLGAERKLQLLYNYECSNDYFPLRWCPEIPDPILRHLGGQDTCLSWLEDHVWQRKWPLIDHIVLIGDAADSSNCYQPALDRLLSAHYTPGFYNGYVHTYTLRPPAP